MRQITVAPAPAVPGRLASASPRESRRPRARREDSTESRLSCLLKVVADRPTATEYIFHKVSDCTAGGAQRRPRVSAAALGQGYRSSAFLQTRLMRTLVCGVQVSTRFYCASACLWPQMWGRGRYLTQLTGLLLFLFELSTCDGLRSLQQAAGSCGTQVDQLLSSLGRAPMCANGTNTET